MTDRKKHRMPRVLGLAGAAVAVAGGVWLGGTAIASSPDRPTLVADSSRTPVPTPSAPARTPTARPSPTRTAPEPVPPTAKPRPSKPAPTPVPCVVRPEARHKTPRPVPTRAPSCPSPPSRVPTVPGLG
jgi:hypothetical protein